MIETDAAGCSKKLRFSLLLLRSLFQFHQSFGCRKHADKGRHQLGKVACRTLYTVHQLQEGSHTTEGQRTTVQTEGTPQECHKEPNGKAHVQEEITAHGKSRTLAYPLAQHLLRTFQPTEHLPVGLHRLHQHTMLHGLGKQTLNQTVGIAYLPVISAHISHIDAAHQDEKRQDGHYREGQPGIHLKQIDEGSQKHSHRAERRWQRLGEECHHRLHVVTQSTDNIATVHSLASTPLGAQQTGQYTLLHSVLRLHTKDVFHPYTRYAYGKLAQNQHSHHAHGGVERAFTCTRRYIDGTLHGPDRRQTQGNAQQSDARIHHRLQAVALQDFP